ncbi:nucleosome assembly protein (NAP) domain-containing protein [Hirsutella rhossiliensis]|uniref:Nucleosome assembly protein (NAP) domain-containing protein n=1 Tax=Hirsutella rhossiliensis TaxID=111463 RepID=A0A9P8SJG4_9HYPO|nr:nucleosome assembly protein (NAP) domain-containing protein [Hirsutella rhossiliensis]KAH0964876.1 nucleosome assembly protein (NAP) domain-containing protein [Hirsutella rhossiliensis]
MAEPIRNKRPDLTAPTPQNTPASNAPISSHAQQPGVASIKEEDMDRAAAASIFAQNPKLVQMIQGRLGSLIGRSSGYIESLPTPVRRRVSGLRAMQKEHSKLEAEFQEEVLQLEKKYFAKFTPLYQKRANIVNGNVEPTEEQVKAGEDSDSQQPQGEGDSAESAPKNADMPENVSGIPEFWLSAMKNQVTLAEMITDRDEAALKHLTDVRMEYLDKPGFRLIFEFRENEYFTNKTITKTYFYQNESGYGGDFIYDHAEGDKIDWHPGKDLTVRVEAKKQRNKSTKQTRIVKKTVPTESFFNFFSPPKPPTDEDGDEDDAISDIEERLELDYQLGEDIKEKLIPRAIDWFTGEALAYEEVDDDDLEPGDFEDDEDDEDDLSEDHDEEEESDEDDDSGKPKQEAAECKQS